MLEIPDKARFFPGELPAILPLCRSRIYQLISEGKIAPVDRCGKKIVIPRDSIVSFLRASESV